MVVTSDPVVPKEFEFMTPIGLEDKLVESLQDWLDQSLNSILKTIPEYSRARVSLKAFTTRNLMSDLNNILNPRRIEVLVKGIVAIIFDRGHDSVEKDLGVNIAHNKAFRNLVSDQSFNKVKGLSDDLATKLREDLLKGWQAGEGITELKKRVKTVWGNKNITDARAETIARTESVFAYNGARMEGAKNSGLPVIKRWNATFDSRTGSDSKFLDGQVRRLNDPFDDRVNGQAVQHPPNRPNCRCRLDIMPATKSMEIASDIKESLGVDEVYLFGSYATGEETPTSDIDFMAPVADEGERARLTTEYKTKIEELQKKHDILIDVGFPHDEAEMRKVVSSSLTQFIKV